MSCLNLWKQSFYIFCIFMISGCSTFRFAPPPPSLYNNDTYTTEEYKVDRTKYENADSGEAKQKLRDKIVYSVAGEIDKNYKEFKNSFFGERASTETLLDMAQIGLATAGTFAGGLSTVNLLAAISTGVAGSRLSFNKIFFKEKSPDLLLSRMDALRTDQWSQIYLKLQENDSTYSLYEAERDLFIYFDKGSLQAAFQDVVADSGAAQKKADNDIKNQIRTKYGEFIGPVAPVSELKEISDLFGEFNSLRGADKENRAKKIVEEFKKLQQNFPINPGASDRNDVDDVGYIFSIARQERFPDVRKALVSAFKTANK